MVRRIAVLVAVLALFSFVAFAQTTVDWNWDFHGGGFNGIFQAGDDAVINFDTGGSHAWGEFHAIDADDNPYSYNVDTVSAKVKAEIGNGGGIYFRMDRNDSLDSMYGPDGQYTETNIWSSDGSGFFATQLKSNYASMITHNYGWVANSQYQVDGSSFSLYHMVHSSADANAWVGITGSGGANLTLMSDEARGNGWLWKFGEGAGCYTNASAEGTGSGIFTMGATAPNQMESGMGWSAGGGTFLLNINYLNGFEIDPINMRGK